MKLAKVNNIIDSRTKNSIAVYSDSGCKYNTIPPFHPKQHYPEYPFSSDLISHDETSAPDAYHGVRTALYYLGYDRENFGTRKWNPFKLLIKPGQKVVIKPNFVLHRNGKGLDIFASVTHPSVIRAVVDFCYIALQGTGSVMVVEAPQMDCDFDDIKKQLHLDALAAFYKETENFKLNILDVRRLKCTRDYEKGYYPSESFIINEQADPEGFTIFDLGAQSLLNNLPGIENLYGADFDRKFTVQNHTKGVHKYCVSNSVLNADTVICLPKLKTHKKVGITLNLKLLVGINCDKNYLAHFRIGPPSKSGDEFPDALGSNVLMRKRVLRFLQDHVFVRRTKSTDKLWMAINKLRRMVNSVSSRKKAAGQVNKIFSGNWYGNDTAWRMAIDLARILLYGTVGKGMSDVPQRNVLSIVDGVMAGEGDGPMDATPKYAGTIIAGENILAVDTAAATLMGFDYRKIRMLNDAWKLNDLPLSTLSLEETRIHSNDESLDGLAAHQCRKFSFVPHRNWRGEIEISKQAAE